MNRILFIGRGFYPPVNSMGAIRLARFFKYFKKFGWDVRVLLLTTNPFLSLPGEISYIYNSKIFSAFELIINRFLKGMDVLSIPLGVYLGAEVIKGHHPDVIYSTSSPIFSHIVGMKLAKIFGIPHVIEFRDPVRQFYTENDSKIDRALTSMLETLEKRILAKTHFFVTISNELLAFFSKDLNNRYPNISIYNCYEENYSSAGEEIPNKFVITYTGKLYGGMQNPEMLFRALKKIIQTNPFIKDKIVLKFVGVTTEDIRFLDKLSSIYALTENISIEGTIDHNLIPSIQKSSTVLLLIMPDTKLSYKTGILPGKFFEYLGARRPIMVLSRYKGEVADILRETNSGCYCTKADEIYEWLLKMLNEFQTKGYIKYYGREDKIENYSCFNQIKRLSEFIKNEVVG